MKRRRFLEASAAGVVAAAIGRNSWAQARAEIAHLFVGFPPGGMVDTVARLLVEPLRRKLGTTFIVENKSGAAGRIGVESVKAAAPDGRSLLLTPSAMIVIYPHIYPDLTYNPFTDLAPVIPVTNIPVALVVQPNHPATTIAEFVAWAKQKPKSATIGTPAAGSGPHFVGMMFGKQSGTELLFVHYRGDPPVLTDVMGGTIDAGVITQVTATPLHRAGRLRALAISGSARSRRLPDVPTFNELGFDIGALEWLGLLAPAKTPVTSIAELNQAVREALETAQVRESFDNFGIEATGSSPEQFASIMKKDFELWGRIVKASGFKIEK